MVLGLTVHTICTRIASDDLQQCMMNAPFRKLMEKKIKSVDWLCFNCPFVNAQPERAAERVSEWMSERIFIGTPCGMTDCINDSRIKWIGFLSWFITYVSKHAYAHDCESKRDDAVWWRKRWQYKSNLLSRTLCSFYCLFLFWTATAAATAANRFTLRQVHLRTQKKHLKLI